MKAFSYRGSYLSYVLTYFFFYFSLGVFSSVLSVYLVGIGKSTAEMAFIVSSASLFGIVLIPLTGFLNDRFRRPRELSMFMILLVAALALVFAFSRSTVALFLLNGFIMGFISSLMPVCERMAGAGGFRYGAVRIWGTFGYAAAAQLAGLVLDAAPSFIFYMLAVSSVLAAAGFYGTRGIQFTDAPKASVSAQFSFALSPSFLLFAAIAFLFSGVSNLNMTYSPMLLTELGVPAGSVGTVLFVSTIVELPIIACSNRFMDRLSGKTLLMLDFCVMILQFLLYSLAPGAFLAVAAMVLLKAVGSTLFVMVTLKVVRCIVSDGAVSTALGLTNAANAVSTILMQNVLGRLAGGIGIRGVYLVLMALSVLGLLLCFPLRVKNNVRSFS